MYELARLDGVAPQPSHQTMIGSTITVVIGRGSGGAT